MKDRRPFERLIAFVGSPYGTLLLVLVATLLAYPFLGSHRALNWLFDLIALGVVAAALRVTDRGQTRYHVIWLLGVSAFISGLLARSLGLDLAYPIGAGLRVLFLGYLIVVIFSDILRRRNITFDAVLGASCVLVMLGLTFGSAYALLEWLVPGSFAIPAVPQSVESVFGPSSTEYQLVYFSLVTMTTIGFGDIVPLAPPARSLAAIEGLLTQLYLAVIIARLVGLEIANRLQNPEAPTGSSS